MNTVIRSTKNYSMFDLYEHNRPVKENTFNFKNLIRSMRRHGFLDAYPLHCVVNGSGKLKIKAGHNRFRAAKIAGVPVKYVVSNDNATVHELEKAGPGKWNAKDYLMSYYRQGIKSYVLIKDFMDETGIGLQNAVSMFFGNTAGSGNYMKYGNFQDGRFEIKNYYHPRAVGDIVLFLKSIGIKWAHEDKFVKALSKVMWVPKFNPDRFKKKATSHIYLIQKKRNVEEYLQMIEDIYNYKVQRRQKINLTFLAQEIAEKRQRIWDR